MKTVLLAVLAASLTVGIIQAIGTGDSFDKYLRYVCALLLTLALLSPLSALLYGELSFSALFPEGEAPPAEVVPEQYLRHFETEIETAVSRLLKEEFSLQIDACRPVASAKDEEGVPKLVHLEIRLYTLKGAALTGKIRDRLEEACGCGVTVVEDVRW